MIFFTLLLFVLAGWSFRQTNTTTILKEFYPGLNRLMYGVVGGNYEADKHTSALQVRACFLLVVSCVWVFTCVCVCLLLSQQYRLGSSEVSYVVVVLAVKMFKLFVNFFFFYAGACVRVLV